MGTMHLLTRVFLEPAALARALHRGLSVFPGPAVTSKDCSGQLGNPCPQVPIVQRAVLSFKSSPAENGWNQGTKDFP